MTSLRMGVQRGPTCEDPAGKPLQCCPPSPKKGVGVQRREKARGAGQRMGYETEGSVPIGAQGPDGCPLALKGHLGVRAKGIRSGSRPAAYIELANGFAARGCSRLQAAHATNASGRRAMEPAWLHRTLECARSPRAFGLSSKLRASTGMKACQFRHPYRVSTEGPMRGQEARNAAAATVARPLTIQ